MTKPLETFLSAFADSLIISVILAFLLLFTTNTLSVSVYWLIAFCPMVSFVIALIKSACSGANSSPAVTRKKHRIL